MRRPLAGAFSEHCENLRRFVESSNLRLYLAVLDAAVHEAGPGVDQPVAAALRLVEQVE